MEYLVHRQEIQEAAEYHKTVDHIVQRIIVKGIDQSQRYCRTDQTDQHTFQHKGRTHEKVGSADIFHNIDLRRTDRNTDSYGIADQEDADCQQDHDDSHGHVGDQKVQTAQCVGCHFGIVDLAHLRNGLQPGHQCILHGDITQENLISILSCQWILGESFCIILTEIIRSEGCPCIICRLELYLGYLCTLGNLLSDLFQALFGRDLSVYMTLTVIHITVEKYRNGYTFFCSLQDILKVGHDAIEQSKQKQTCGYRGNGCQRIPFIPENIGKSLLDRIKKCTNLHRYTHPSLRH